MKKKFVIIDGYVDEPAQFGVPPYISPDIRYAWGCYAHYGVFPDYFTIDQVRKLDLWNSLNSYYHLILIGGVSVPGKYIGGNPLKFREIRMISDAAPNPLKIYHGPYTMGYTASGGKVARELTGLKDMFDYVVTGNIETFLFHLLKGELPSEGIRRDPGIQSIVAPKGAQMIKLHPGYPTVMNEIELSTGCERETHCSFCTEPLVHHGYWERPVDDCLNEMEALSEAGGKYFRLGRVANIISYGADKNGPNPQKIEELYRGIHERTTGLKVLHTDNANPATIYKHPGKSREVLKAICRYNTPGDILSLGVESFDPEVIIKNNLGTDPEDIVEAVRIINEIGGKRVEGVPKLLPGINILFGLIGETNDTYSINLEYLKTILEDGLLLRRINIRQAMIFHNTPLYNYSLSKKIKIKKKAYKRFKENVRNEVDHQMLKRVFPVGTILKEVKIEYNRGNVYFGRQLGTYPILIGIREQLEKGSFVKIRIIDHGYRSITGELIKIRE